MTKTALHNLLEWVSKKSFIISGFNRIEINTEDDAIKNTVRGMPRYKAVRAPQLIERGFLDALTEKQVWLIRGRVLDTHEGEWAGSDAEAFCEELELYLKMRNPDEHMRVCRGAAEQLRGQPDDDLAEILFDNGIREIKSHEWRFVTGVDTSHLKQNDSITWEEV